MAEIRTGSDLCNEFRQLLDEGLADIEAGRMRPADDVFADISAEFDFVEPNY